MTSLPFPGAAGLAGSDLRSVAEIERTFGDPRLRTDGEPLALAFAADGTLWSMEESGVLRQWQATTGEQLRWRELSDLEMLWAFNGQARVLAGASDELTLWDVESGEVAASVAQPCWVTALTFRGNSDFLATGHDDGVVRLWDGQQRLVRELHAHRLQVSALAFHPAGHILASAGEDRAIHLWDVASGKRLGSLNGHTDRVQALAWHPSGNPLISVGWDTTARLWDTTTCQPIILLNAHADQVMAVAFSPSGAMLACADSSRALYIWDPARGKVLHVCKEHAAEIRCLAFSPDNHTLASGGADRVIHLWDAQQGELRLGRRAPAAERSRVVVRPDGSRLASTCAGVRLQQWETSTAQALPTLEKSANVDAIAYSPDGRWLAGGGPDTLLRLWRADTGALETMLEGQKGGVTGVSFSPDSKLLASVSGTDEMVWLWDVATREPVLIVPEAADRCTVHALAFHPDGQILACAGIDWLAQDGKRGALCLWDIEGRRPLARWDNGGTCLAFHPSGRWLASGFEEVVTVWCFEDGTLARELTGHEAMVTSVVYSPDGRWLVSAGDDRTVRLWDVNTGDLLAVRELDTRIKALGFAPDGRTLFTANGNTACYQLNVEQFLRG